MIDVNLFAGAGGLAVGLRLAGFSPTHFYELDTYSCQTLRHNMGSPERTLDGPVFQINVLEVHWPSVRGPVRLLAAAAPCQPFSLAGKHRAERDGRNLFPEVLRAIRALRPKVVLLENVRGLLRQAFQPYFEYLLRQLECPSIEPKPHEYWHKHDERIRRHQCSVGYKPEYHVAWRLLDAADFGVPQNRQRVFILATRSDLPYYRFPAPTHSRNALLRLQSSGEYWDQHGIAKPCVLPGNGLTPGPDDGLQPWMTVRDALIGLPAPAADEREASMNHWLIPGARQYIGHAGSILDWPAKTIKAGVHGVPGGENTLVIEERKIRYFTLRESARLQTFPDTHLFQGARIHVTRQVGNAVPPRLASAVARPLHGIASRPSTLGEGKWK